MNTVNVIGRITSGPVRKGHKIKFKIECTRVLGTRRLIDTIPCVCFGRTADAVEKDVHNGERWLASGRWSVSSFENEEGVRVTVSEMVVTMMAKPLDTLTMFDDDQ